ncbi:MAG: hypothetical protein ACYC9D_12835 [Candidatus Dormibacteria bacterium]
MALTWKMDAQIAGISALTASDAASFLSAACPSLFTIRTFRQARLGAQDETAADLRRGMALGSSLAVLAGLGGTAVTGSWGPLATTVVTLVVLNGAYEWAIRSPRGTADMTGAA